MSFQILDKSIFDTKVDAYVNTINCVGAMGAGIALEFKNRYPEMFSEYKQKCQRKEIKPGDCYVYKNADGMYLLGLAVKNDWRNWSTIDWVEQSIQSMKLVLLENDIKSVSMPLPGGKNGRRGPYGPVPGCPPPPEDTEELKRFVENLLLSYANKFNIEINLCIPTSTSNTPVKKASGGMTLDSFFTV